MSDACDTAVKTTPEPTISSSSPLQREATASMHDAPLHVGLGAAALPHCMSSWELLDLEGDGCPAVFSTSSHSESGSLATCAHVAASRKAGGSHTSEAATAATEAGSASAEPPFVLLQLFGAGSCQSADDATSEHVLSSVAAPFERPHCCSGLAKFVEGHYSLACSASTLWSYLSTTSQTPLPAAHTGPCPESGTTANTTLNDDDIPAANVTEPTSTGQSGSRELHDGAFSPLYAGAGMPGTWRADSMPLASHPTATPHSYGSPTEQTGHSIGATSYAAAMVSEANTILIPRIISVATTPLTSDGEQCMGESRVAGAWTPTLMDSGTHGEHAAVASLGSALPSPSYGAPVLLEDGTQRLGEEVSVGVAQSSAAAAAVLESQLELDGPSSVPPSPRPDAGGGVGPRGGSQQPAVRLARLPKPLVSLCDRRRNPCLCQGDAHEGRGPHTADTDCAKSVSAQSRQREKRKAATWLLRRMSFISSSSLAASLLPSAMTNAAFPSAAAAATSAAEAVPAASSPASTLDPSLLWSQACIVCAGGSQRAMKGLQRLCNYVWQDLKNHWYPQLRLVLGDHSSARKTHGNRHARYRLKPKRTPENDKSATATDGAAAGAAAVVSPAASSSPAGTAQWRSLSSPCFFNGDVRVTRDSSAHPRMSGREAAGAVAPRHFHPSSSSSSSSSPSSPSPGSSTKDGMRLYVVMTAEAVASAAQGLLVFLL
ncbi:hypothetical protein GH5_06837 [Leishmania sp. Ghana 2012 LV757]|uniref:hypothetical protein n=1 Tax=Leishmania sp. Ghana 2012 LV757 TaxID=2803181 RepID=UPI001B51E7F3|nr:hypothetical protein GH5_06837 [Leishmania sp. Ghana 2012 LV757]